MLGHIKNVDFINDNYAPTLNSHTLNSQDDKTNYEILDSCPELKEIK